jgi:hypothetical protein
MLERIALHQTRLRTPGIGTDPKGIALGAKGLVVVGSLEKLVLFLAAYTRERSLEDIMPTLAMYVVSSKLGAREIALEFSADSSDRMDRMAEIARLVGGFTFTGTSRHFVQYRDSAAPFGYDATELLSSDAALILYHDRFSQTYDLERRIELRSLLLRLMPRPEPSSKIERGVRILTAEQGLGPAAVHYFVRSRVEGEVCVAEWPPPSAFDAPVRRWIMRIPELPERMRPLVHSTPGISCFVPAGQGVAVEAGYRHPVDLRACPVFDAAGLVLMRGRADEPWVIEHLPPMGPLSAFARVEMRTEGEEASVARRTMPADTVRVPLRVTPSIAPRRNVTATWVAPAQASLLRRLAYALPRATIARSRLATTPRGLFVLSRDGIEAIPLGMFFVEIDKNLFVPAGYDVTPAVAPGMLASALNVAPSHVVFIGTDARGLAIEERAFVPLETALIEAPSWEPLAAKSIEDALFEVPIDLKVTPVGSLPNDDTDRPLRTDG